MVDVDVVSEVGIPVVSLLCGVSEVTTVVALETDVDKVCWGVTEVTSVA